MRSVLGRLGFERWGVGIEALGAVDAFAELGLERRLVVEGEAVQEAFRRAGARMHPDAGGSVEAFERLEEARRVLIEPGRRLRHWLELEGIEGEWRGSLSSGLMDLFDEVGAGLQRAEEVRRERERASSALARAMLEGRLQEARERVEALQERVEAEQAAREARFEAVARGEVDGWELARELAFLGKWRAQLRESFAALWSV